MANPTGHRKPLEQLRADGIRYLFWNPGSSEEGLLDESTRFPEITYILVRPARPVITKYAPRSIYP